MRPCLARRLNTISRYSYCSLSIKELIRILSRKIVTKGRAERMEERNLTNVAGELRKPKGKRSYSYRPAGEVTAVFGISREKTGML